MISPKPPRTTAAASINVDDFALFYGHLLYLMCFIPVTANPYIHLERDREVRGADHVCP
jgi:hypothetical protein